MTVQSMTGFALLETQVESHRYRLEIKTLNHRFLDLKLRLPKEFSSAEIPLRTKLSSRLSRGSLEFKLERVTESQTGSRKVFNQTVAAAAVQELQTLQTQLGLPGPVSVSDILAFPDLFSQDSAPQFEEPWSILEPWVDRALEALIEMRTKEGFVLAQGMRATLGTLAQSFVWLRKRRAELQAQQPERIKEKIAAIFDAYPLPANGQAVLDARIAQELAMAFDRADIEEELTRFEGHLKHFGDALDQGGPVGRKLEFILQELGREINTLTNKALDLAMSEEAISVKVRVEQIREQVMNLE